MPIASSNLNERECAELRILLDDSCQKIRVLAWRDPLIARLGRKVSRRVDGLFDRTLGRIELFGCDAEVRDVDLVGVLIHELLHAKGALDEALVRSTAHRLTAALAPETVARIADDLRAAARVRRIGHPAGAERYDSPLGMGR